MIALFFFCTVGLSVARCAEGPDPATIEYQKISELKIVSSVEASLKIQGKPAGFLKYVKLPFVKVVVFYDFYIKPEFRGKRLGSFFGDSVLKKVLHNEKVSYIVIQPGPFELSSRSNMHQMSGDERSKRRDELVKMYASRGFKRYSNVVLTPMLRLVYRMVGIDEDPSFLMIGDVRELKHKLP